MVGHGVAVSSVTPGQLSPSYSPSEPRVWASDSWVLSVVEWGEPSFSPVEWGEPSLSPVEWGELSFFLVQPCLEPCDRP